MSIEAMKQAVEALESINEISKPPMNIPLAAEIDGAMDALRQAIEQAERKPVKSFSGGVPWYATEEPISATTDKAEISATADNKEIERLKVEVKRLQDLAEYRLKLLMQMPENKPWVNLTNEELVELRETYQAHIFQLMFAVEAKLREKNT
jgi:hypothetical protein